MNNSYFITDGNGVITGFDQMTLDFKESELIIPSEIDGEKIRCIGYGVFRNCNRLHVVIIPDTVKSIGDFAFAGCCNLTKVIICEGVERIGHGVFRECTSLQVITIPKSIILLGYNIFQDCKSLTTVNYAGTEEEWNAIEKPKKTDWFDKVIMPIPEPTYCDMLNSLLNKKRITLRKTFEEHYTEDIDKEVNTWIREMYKTKEITGFNIISITSYALDDYHACCIIYTINE